MYNYTNVAVILPSEYSVRSTFSISILGAVHAVSRSSSTAYPSWYHTGSCWSLPTVNPSFYGHYCKHSTSAVHMLMIHIFQVPQLSRRRKRKRQNADADTIWGWPFSTIPYTLPKKLGGVDGEVVSETDYDFRSIKGNGQLKTYGHNKRIMCVLETQKHKGTGRPVAFL